MDRRIELIWLGKQRLPMWGGHLERGESASDPQICQWVAEGLIEAVGRPWKGYVLTAKGKEAARTYQQSVGDSS